MKLAISNIAWDAILNDEVYSLLNENKFDGIEVAPTIWFPDAPYKHIEEAIVKSVDLKNKNGLSILSIQSICYGIMDNLFNSTEEFNSLLNHVMKSIDFASSIGCPNIVFGCPKNRIMNVSSKVEVAKDFFKLLGDYASNRRVIVSIEPNPEIYGTNFLNTTIQAIDFVKLVNHPNIRLNLDLGTMIYYKEEFASLSLKEELIGHIHISEPNLELIKLESIHFQLKELLKNIDYSRCISIEMKKQSFDDLKRTIKFISEVFNDK